VELREATRLAHGRLEERVDIESRFRDRAGYIAHLRRLWGFYASFEAALDPRLLDGALPDLELRWKCPLLKKDLECLDPCTDVLDAIPTCSRVPACFDTSQAFGCLYVLEGSTLGAKSLLGVAAASLGVDRSNGAAYLASYGANVPAMWSTFRVALDLWCNTDARLRPAIDSAVLTFDCVADWLCEGAQ
jgi:heme oxygenase